MVVEEVGVCPSEPIHRVGAAAAIDDAGVTVPQEEVGPVAEEEAFDTGDGGDGNAVDQAAATCEVDRGRERNRGGVERVEAAIAVGKGATVGGAGRRRVVVGIDVDIVGRGRGAVERDGDVVDRCRVLFLVVDHTNGPGARTALAAEALRVEINDLVGESVIEAEGRTCVGTEIGKESDFVPRRGDEVNPDIADPARGEIDSYPDPFDVDRRCLGGRQELPGWVIVVLIVRREAEVESLRDLVRACRLTEPGFGEAHSRERIDEAVAVVRTEMEAAAVPLAAGGVVPGAVLRT